MTGGNKSIFKKLGLDLNISDSPNKNEIKEMINTLKEHNIFIYGDNEDFKSSDGKTFRDTILENPSTNFETLNEKHADAEKISEYCKKKYGNDKGKMFSICFAEKTKPPKEIKTLFLKALELANIKED